MIKVGSIDKKTIGTEYLEFEYFKQPLKEWELKLWKDQGYYHPSFSGEMYNSTNPIPIWTNSIAEQIGLTNCGFVFYRMNTLDIMPPHLDHFETYSRVFNVDVEKAHRAIVFLEDWKPGHYFEYNHKGFVNWNAGDFVLYSSDVLHAASNIGTESRYTLQITGTL